MNCYAHEDRVAVAACGKCGAGLCKECEINTIFRLKKFALCNKCNNIVGNENDSFFKSILTIKQAVLLVNIISCVIGIILFIILFLTGVHLFGAVAVMLICWSIGFFISPFIDKNIKIKETKTEKVTTPYPILNTILNILFSLISILFKGVLSPFMILGSLIGIYKVKKQIAENNEKISMLNT